VGRARTKQLYRASMVLPLLLVVAVAPKAPAALLALAAAPLAVPPLRIVATRSDPPSLVAALIATGRLQLVFSVLLAVGLSL
jgi:1,4-dihydroxy-2-naphthoate polyprenyltransferase